MGRVYVVGTADTKGEELAFLAERIVARGAEAVIVDVGTGTASVPVGMTASVDRVSRHGIHAGGTRLRRPWPRRCAR